MDDLVLLKKIACDYNILLVEDSKHISIKLREFLEKFFMEIDFAYNGFEGIEKFKNKKYDIVLTDINMPKLNGNKLVQELTKLDPNVQIIVISAFGYDENMVTFNKFGVVDFIQKPIDNLKLVKALITSIENLKIINSDVKHISFTLSDEISKKLNAQKEADKTVELINSFKGVSIIQEGYLREINPNTLTIETTDSQYYLIKCEKRTIIVADNIVLRTNLQYIDKTTNQLILKKFETLDRSPKDRKVPRVTPDPNFTLSRHYKGGTFNYDVLALSVDSISVKTSNTTEEFELDSVVDLVLGFQLSYCSRYKVSHHRKKILKPVKIRGKGRILRIDEMPDGNKKIVFLLIFTDESRKRLGEYIMQRETDILNELHSLTVN